MGHVDALLHYSTHPGSIAAPETSRYPLASKDGQIYGFRVAVSTLGGSQSRRLILLPPTTTVNDTVSNQIWQVRSPTPVLAYWLLPLLRKVTLYRELLGGPQHMKAGARQLLRHGPDGDDAITFGFLALIEFAGL